MALRLPVIFMAGLAAAMAIAQPSPADRQFLKEATAGNRGEMALGRLAARQGGSASIRKFGQQMVSDHGLALTQVTRLAARKRVTVPGKPKSEDQSLRRRLSRLHGRAFDRAYRDAMVDDHEKDVAEFAREASSGRDSDVRNWAKKTLPTLRMHLQMIRAARI